MDYQSKLYEKIASTAELCALLPKWKAEHQKIVFTNGCFDIIHRGHVDYLMKAAAFGDKLIIGLNTDASVKRLKGNSRPIIDQQSRAQLLAAFAFVDAVIFFDEDTPYQLIEKIQPDILVKGADYQVENIVGYDIVTKKGGKVMTIDFVDGCSTTNIINKIKNL
ncbi:MAG: D-glycero-beta-D-manno-heptose 1-phosphate adenylyltransferase [Bacteroidales bacterium]|nr:D-glycero-beta-D-manno-heptose 1-phosphate adenylyltransferase [Bacteroidales bacterium]